MTATVRCTPRVWACAHPCARLPSHRSCMPECAIDTKSKPLGALHRRPARPLPAVWWPLLHSGLIPLTDAARQLVAA
jgi:hypothetical protein